MTRFEWEQVEALRDALRHLISDVDGESHHDKARDQGQAALNGFACSVSEPDDIEAENLILKEALRQKNAELEQAYANWKPKWAQVYDAGRRDGC